MSSLLRITLIIMMSEHADGSGDERRFHDTRMAFQDTPGLTVLAGHDADVASKQQEKNDDDPNSSTLQTGNEQLEAANAAAVAAPRPPPRPAGRADASPRLHRCPRRPSTPSSKPSAD